MNPVDVFLWEALAIVNLLLGVWALRRRAWRPKEIWYSDNEPDPKRRFIFVHSHNPITMSKKISWRPEVDPWAESDEAVERRLTKNKHPYRRIL